MSQEPRTCPKCSGTMRIGFIPDHAHANYAQKPFWHPGEPEFRFFGNVKAKSEASTPIASFRCSDCGFLEFYAHKKHSRHSRQR